MLSSDFLYPRDMRSAAGQVKTSTETADPVAAVAFKPWRSRMRVSLGEK
jgi:hypothetical protein